MYDKKSCDYSTEQRSVDGPDKQGTRMFSAAIRETHPEQKNQLPIVIYSFLSGYVKDIVEGHFYAVMRGGGRRRVMIYSRWDGREKSRTQGILLGEQRSEIRRTESRDTARSFLLWRKKVEQTGQGCSCGPFDVQARGAKPTTDYATQAPRNCRLQYCTWSVHPCG